MAFQEGVGTLRRALHREIPVEGVWIPRDLRLPPDVYHLLRARGIPLHRMDAQAFAHRFGGPPRVVFRLADLQPIAPETFFQRLAPRGFGVVLDEVQDVGNVGNIARSAAFFGAVGLVLPTRRSVPLSGELHHASSGGASRVAWCRVGHLPRFLQDARERGIWIYVLETDGVPLERVAFAFPLLLVVGAEKRGVRRSVRRYADAVIRIPGRQLASLNVASATAIALYEIARQQRASSRS